ncbi:arsenate reductase (glutaredoxin) [Sphingobium limneticum]|jgi:arsenate reductase|uniref:Arsenate reductase (Glutaredoxin) n=1 Tax=Sphingobium limneticum TaxID=1007511 RepID=A0A5J5HT23_9SPHN|nr:arsenate reductase (glutaredoxin) [Sphingobium limneticum]KAA9025417.1 arsenate reductase (glutaredoxin) [Sphingobium limneticum]
MTDRIYNVLFLCTGNSARSILGEGLMNKLGEGRFRAYSAGSQPKGTVHPMAISVLNGIGIDTTDMRSKSWDEFAGAGAPQFDFIFTVCDNAAGETCPVWIGHPTSAHWGIEDPAAVEGEGQRDAFIRAIHYLRNRISLFLALPFDSLDDMAVRRKLREIGQGEGASVQASAETPGEGITIYHNPDCGTSRNTLAMIRNAGIDPEVIEYLKNPPSRETLVDLIDRAGLTPRALLREKGTPYADLGLGDESLSDDVLVDAMMAHPILINRPLVVTPLGVRLCRPSEVVLDILPSEQRGAFTKEDGERVVDDAGRKVN